MADSRHCKPCGNNFPLSASLCPHCGRPSYYPNVDAANDIEEERAIIKASKERLQKFGVKVKWRTQ